MTIPQLDAIRKLLVLWRGYTASDRESAVEAKQRHDARSVDLIEERADTFELCADALADALAALELTIVDDLDTIKQRAAAATKGPWRVRDATAIVLKNEVRVPDRIKNQFMREDYLRVTGFVADCNRVLGEGAANATFIAHAREDIPALIEAVEQQQTELTSLRARLRKQAMKGGRNA